MRLEQLGRDLVHAWRGLWLRPAFTIAAIATLALGIGANTAVFSVLNGMLLKPLPYVDGDSLVQVYSQYPRSGLDYAGVSIPDYLDRREAAALADLALYTGSSYNLAGDDGPARLSVLRSTASLFSTLQVQAALGRVFGPEEEVAGADRVIVLSDALWRTRFAADPAIVGRELRLNDEAYRVIGVMGPGFAFPKRDYAAWVPFSFSAEQRLDSERGNEFSEAIGRLRPGATVAQLEAQFAAQVVRNAERIAGLDDPRAAGFAEFLTSGAFIGRARDLRSHWVGELTGVLYLLQGVVLFVLLIACANVANLMLTRVLSRQRELSVRAALGAGRWRLLQQLLAEALLLALLGGAAGVLVAQLALKLMNLFQLGGGLLAEQVALDPLVLLFTLSISVATGLLAGLLPALGQFGPRRFEALKEGGRNRGGGRQAALARSALVVLQMSLAVCLLVAAGLLLRSFDRLQQQSPGFNSEGVLSARFDLPPGRHGSDDARRQFVESSLQALRALPGVSAAAYVSNLPFGGSYWQASYDIDGREFPVGQQPHGIPRIVDEDWFDLMQIRLLRGRVFERNDQADTEAVVVIDRLLAEKYFADQDPVGQRLSWGGRTDKRSYRIIGVVDAIRHQDLSASPSKESYYLLHRQVPASEGFLLLRSALPLAELAGPMREAVLAVDPQQPLYSIMSLQQRIDLSLQQRRAPMSLLLVFAAVALLLAAIGIYGVLAFGVQQRAAEMGVRMAIGARAGDVQRLVLGQGSRLVGIGLLLGAGAAMLLSRALETQLYGVSRSDPWTYVGVMLVLALVALGACWLPARRASRTDPMVALRHE